MLPILSPAGGGVVMAFYSVMLIVPSRRAPPEAARPKGWRLPVMVILAGFCVSFSVYSVYDVVLVGGVLG